MVKIKLLIEELMKERGLQKQYIAQQLGVSKDTITNWIKGRTCPDLNQAVQLAGIFNCDVNDLYERND